MKTEKKLTAMQELRNHIKDMINEGGDDDLRCVMGLINDKFLEKEKQQIIDSSNNSYLNSDLIKRTGKNKKVKSLGEQYYEQTFKK